MLLALTTADIASDDDPLAVPTSKSGTDIKSGKDNKSGEGDFDLGDLDFDAPNPNDPKAQKAAAALKEMQSQHVQVVGSGDAAISFLPTMSKENVKKILNSIWIAQSAAQLRGYDKQKDPIEYFAFFNTVIKALGWTVGVEKWQKFKQSSNEQYMGAAVVDILIATMEAVATSGASALGTGLSTLKSLKSQSKNGRIPMFKGNSESMDDNSFAIGTCSQDTFDIASMSSSIFTYKTNQNQGGFWFWAWKTHSVTINFQAVKMSLNDEVYEDARPKMENIRRAMSNQQLKNATWQIKSEDVQKALATPDKHLDGPLGISYKKNGKRLGATLEQQSGTPWWNCMASPRAAESAQRQSVMRARCCRHEEAIASFQDEIGSCPDQEAYLKHMEEFIKFVEYSKKTRSNGFSKTDASHEFVQKVKGPHGGWHYYKEADFQLLGRRTPTCSQH